MFRKSYPKSILMIALLVISLVSCQVLNPFLIVSQPTQDVGEEPPTHIQTPTTISPRLTITATQVEDAGPEAMLIGPAPYPTPDMDVIPWEQLIHRELLADVNWEVYRGDVSGNDKNSQWTYSFSYPSGWFSDTKSSLIQGFVQNIPVTQEPAQSEFVKFEIVRLADSPIIEEGRAVNLKDLITVEIEGERGIMYSVTQQADRMRQIMVTFQHDDGWLVATGYINLTTADAAALERYTAIIYEILSSFTFAGRGDVDFPVTSTPLPAAQKKPADSDYPASGICTSSPENIVPINIAPGNIPDPRCMKVSADQRLQFKNETGAAVRIQLGEFDVTLQNGEITTFDLPCGDYLEPGVHHAILSNGSIPEIWLVVN